MDTHGAPNAPLIGTVVVAPDGDRLGEIAAVAIDVRTRRPDWLVISCDGATRTAVPSYVASLTAHGDLAVPFSRVMMRHAPSVPDDTLDEQTALAVLTYFGLPR